MFYETHLIIAIRTIKDYIVEKLTINDLKIPKW